MVAQQTLTLFVWVQILVPLPGSLGNSGAVFFRGVAQFGRALRSGRRSRRFKSCHLDHFSPDRVARRDFLWMSRTSKGMKKFLGVLKINLGKADQKRPAAVFSCRSLFHGNRIKTQETKRLLYCEKESGSSYFNDQTVKTSRPSMKTFLTVVETSNGQPSVMTMSASLPTSREPTLSAAPICLAGLMVIA